MWCVGETMCLATCALVLVKDSGTCGLRLVIWETGESRTQADMLVMEGMDSEERKVLVNDMESGMEFHVETARD